MNSAAADTASAPTNKTVSREPSMVGACGGPPPAAASGEPPMNGMRTSAPNSSRPTRRDQRSHANRNSQAYHYQQYQAYDSASTPSPRGNAGETSSILDGARGGGEKPLSQFNPATLDTQSLHSRRTLSTTLRYGSCVSLNQLGGGINPGAMVLYDPQAHGQLVRAPSTFSIHNGDYYGAIPPPSLWYGAPPPPPFTASPLLPPPLYFGGGGAMPPMQPVDFATFRKAMKLEKKKMNAEKKKHESKCSQFCCGGVARILWAIIAITVFGLITALIFALFYA